MFHRVDLMRHFIHVGGQIWIIGTYFLDTYLTFEDRDSVFGGRVLSKYIKLNEKVVLDDGINASTRWEENRKKGKRP